MQTDQISHPEMVRVLAKNGMAILETLKPGDCHVIHAVLGMFTEAAGEILTFTSRENLIEELGDYEFYAEMLRQHYEIDYSKTTGWEQFVASTRPEIGLVIAVGDLADYVVKKRIIYQKTIEPDVVLSKMALCEFYVDMIRKAYDITREEVIAANISKLAKRYEGFKYSDGAAQARADKLDEHLHQGQVSDGATTSAS